MDDFHGVKVALLCKDKILIYLRDDKPGLIFAGLWDLPGGAREGKEKPQETAIREIGEEFGIIIKPSQLFYIKSYPSMSYPGVSSKFIVGNISERQIEEIHFGSEGQHYKIIEINEYLKLKKAVKPLQDRFREYLITKQEVILLQV